MEGPARCVIGLHIRRRCSRWQRREVVPTVRDVTPLRTARERVVQLCEGARPVDDDGYVLRLDGIDALLLRLVSPASMGGHAESSVRGEAVWRCPPANQLDDLVWAPCRA
eukprot:5939625-Pleurochrysis_carterae.AAC.1